MSEHYFRGRQLMQLGRHSAAADEFRRELVADPECADSHGLLAMCLLEEGKYPEATSAAEAAVRYAPDDDFGHFALARAWRCRKHYDKALVSLAEALRINPDDAANHGLKAAVLFDQLQWKAALDAAETGLRCDAEDSGCNNIRAMALVKLGRGADAAATIDAVLARDPENSFSHANMGWTKLDGGEVRDAMHHFREALRLDPSSEYARQGIVEALKARNPAYRLVLRMGLSLVKLPKSVQWSIFVGGFVGYRLLRGFAAANPTFSPAIGLLLSAYMVFCWCAWFAVPVFNLLLRFDRDGRHALNDEQIRESNWLVSLLSCYLVLQGCSYLDGFGWLRLPALFVIALSVPISFMFDCSPGWPRKCMVACVWMTCILAVVFLASPFLGLGAYIVLLLRANIAMVVVSAVAGMYLSGVEPKT